MYMPLFTCLALLNLSERSTLKQLYFYFIDYHLIRILIKVFIPLVSSLVRFRLVILPTS